MVSIYPLVDYKSMLQIKSSLLWFASMIQFLINYLCLVKASSHKNIQNLNLPNKFSEIYIKVTWLLGNEQTIYNITEIFILSFYKIGFYV